MPKSLTESIRAILNKMDEAVGGNYDFTMEVENWQDPEIEDDPNYQIDRTLGINYKIYGTYRPATWGDRGGDPPEYPELDEVEVFDAETGEPLQNLPPDIERQIEDAIWKHAEDSKDRDFDPPDNDYDRY